MDIRQTFSYKDELESVIKGRYFIHGSNFPTVDHEVITFSTDELSAITVYSGKMETIQWRKLSCRFNILEIDNLLSDIGETAILLVNVGVPSAIIPNGILIFSNLNAIENINSSLTIPHGSINYCPPNALSYSELDEKGGILSLEDWNSPIWEDSQVGHIIPIKVRSVSPYDDISDIKEFLYVMTSRLESIMLGTDINWKYLITQSLFDSELTKIDMNGISVNRIDDCTISLYNVVQFNDISSGFDNSTKEIMKSASRASGLDFIISLIIKDHPVDVINTIVAKLKLSGYFNSMVLYTNKLPHDTDLIEVVV